MVPKKNLLSITFILWVITSMVLSACSTNSSREEILYDQTGILSWKGSPAADGAGMLFEVGDTQYGAPGVPEDYSNYFEDDEYEEIMIKADIKLTGENTIRGWGATFPEIGFIRIERY